LNPKWLFYLFGVYLFIACSGPTPVDEIFYNGKIFTSRGENDFVSAIAIKDGKIIAVGNRQELFHRYIPTNAEGINLGGRLVVPGFHDSHVHFWNGAKLHHQLDLRGITSLDSVLRKVKEAVARTKPGEWIIGRGWDHELWKKKVLPTKRELDKISRKHYIYLKRVDGHAAWVNSAVLWMLHYTAQTPDPPGGKIMRFPLSKVPNGILFDTAFEILDKIIPELTFNQKYHLLEKNLAYANRLGLTSITDLSPNDLYPVYAQLYKDNKLTLRVNFFITFDQNMDSLRHYFSQFVIDKQFLQAHLVKLYADGSLGSRTAYLKAPYRDDPQNIGLAKYTFPQLLEKVRRIDEAGFQVGIHGIGDAAIHEILAVYDSLRVERPQPHRRWRIEHAQVMDSADFSLFALLGVIAAMQPSHCITDLHWAGDRIGKRTRFSYAWKTFLKHRIVLAFGTDWPVEPLNPMIGLYAAVTRQDTLGYSPGGWHPEERISMGQAMMAYTLGSSYAYGNELWCGSLQPGRVADFVVLDRDLFTIEPEEILKAKVLATYVGGKQVFSSPLFP